jgi:hypothetical protein
MNGGCFFFLISIAIWKDQSMQAAAMASPRRTAQLLA